MPKDQSISVDKFLSERTFDDSGVVYRAASMPRSFDAESRSATFVMTDETIDSYGDIVIAGGVDLERFNKNPIALLNHRADKMVGTWADVQQKGKRLEGRATIAEEGTSDVVDETFKLMSQGILRAASIGFMPTKLERRLDEDGEPMWSYIIREWDLYECSIVSVPANPAALAKAMQNGDKMARELVEEGIDTFSKTSLGLFVQRKTLEEIEREANGNRTSVKAPGISASSVSTAESSTAASGDESTADAKSAEAGDAASDDLRSLSVDTINLLAERGMAFVTERKTGEESVTGYLLANSWSEADTLVKESETVTGQLVSVVDLAKASGDVTVRDVCGQKLAVKTKDRPEGGHEGSVKLKLGVDTTEAEEGLTRIESRFSKLFDKLPNIFSSKSPDDRVEPTVEKTDDTPATGEEMAAAHARFASVQERLKDKGLM